MFTTTRDRALAAAAAAEHVATYGAPLPVQARKIAKALVILVLSVVAFVIFAHMLGNAWDVQHCQTVLDSFSGPTDSPAAVACNKLLNG